MAKISEPRALLDRGPHVQRLLEQLGDLRAGVVRARDQLGKLPGDADHGVAVRAMARLAGLQQQVGEVYRELLTAHEAHPLARHTVSRVLQAAVVDFGELADQLAMTSIAVEVLADEPVTVEAGELT